MINVWQLAESLLKEDPSVISSTLEPHLEDVLKQELPKVKQAARQGDEQLLAALRSFAGAMEKADTDRSLAKMTGTTSSGRKTPPPIPPGAGVRQNTPPSMGKPLARG